MRNRAVSVDRYCENCGCETVHRTGLMATQDDRGPVMLRAYRCSWCKKETFQLPGIETNNQIEKQELTG